MYGVNIEVFGNVWIEERAVPISKVSTDELFRVSEACREHHKAGMQVINL
jgi:hypothetical protein